MVDWVADDDDDDDERDLGRVSLEFISILPSSYCNLNRVTVSLARYNVDGRSQLLRMRTSYFCVGPFPTLWRHA